MKDTERGTPKDSAKLRRACGQQLPEGEFFKFRSSKDIASGTTDAFHDVESKARKLKDCFRKYDLLKLCVHHPVLSTPYIDKTKEPSWKTDDQGNVITYDCLDPAEKQNITLEDSLAYTEQIMRFSDNANLKDLLQWQVDVLAYGASEDIKDKMEERWSRLLEYQKSGLVYLKLVDRMLNAHHEKQITSVYTTFKTYGLSKESGEHVLNYLHKVRSMLDYLKGSGESNSTLGRVPPDVTKIVLEHLHHGEGAISTHRRSQEG